jgi:hypothetical protein
MDDATENDCQKRPVRERSRIGPLKWMIQEPEAIAANGVYVMTLE